MLGSQFKEGAELSRASEQHYMELYDLELPEDDAGAMITAMRVLHHNNHQVPHKVSEAELVELAVISEKYELYEAMYPRTLQWIPPHIEEALESESGIDGYLFVAWAFREKPLFEKLSRFLIIESTLAQDGSLIPRHGMQLLQSIPESILSMF